ncbi:hypothetical protein TCAL_15894 [Tigriopus californicus]|uniref:Uncharacterized protein n=1 Tax=Tigriopus californicus TaxID=6832 RepID=A0A553NR45_TIGCA|nr:hypothetical protein TCAL_15894 [Tigriopus californicus]
MLITDKNSVDMVTSDRSRDLHSPSKRKGLPPKLPSKNALNSKTKPAVNGSGSLLNERTMNNRNNNHIHNKPVGGGPLHAENKCSSTL